MTLLLIIGVIAIPLFILAVINQAERAHITFIQSLSGILDAGSVAMVLATILMLICARKLK